MKKSILTILLLTASFICFSQNIDNFKKFDVGPFEVIDEDNNYRLRDGVSIPEYFELKKPMDVNSFQIDIFFSLPGIVNVNTYGVDFIWKRKISDNWFVNAGIEAAFPSAKSNGFVLRQGGDEPVIEKCAVSSVSSYYLGIPVTLEYVWGKKKILSGYFGFGLTPGGYSNGAIKADVEGVKKEQYTKFGFFLAPRVDLGFYAPAGRNYFRAGILLEYKADLTDSNVENRFMYGIGCFMPGINLGLVF